MRDIKITIPVSEKDRYITLDGEPIQRKKPKSPFLTMEFSASVICAGGAAVLNPADAPVLVPLSLIAATWFQRTNRKETTKILDKPEWRGENGAPLVIDKKPDAATVAASARKYGYLVRDGRQEFMSRASIDGLVYGTSIGFCAALFTSGGMTAMAMHAGSFVRDARDIYRFNKLAKGEWAIVDEPPKQEKLKKEIEISVPVPHVSGPLVPQGA